jgi:hypothetical protein
MKFFSEKKLYRKTKDIFCALNFLFGNCAVYEIIWRDTVERGRLQMILWRMRFACWVPKATDTHTRFVLYSLFFHRNNSCTNALQCYVIFTLPVLLILKFNSLDTPPLNTRIDRKWRKIFCNFHSNLRSPWWYQLRRKHLGMLINQFMFVFLILC